MNYRASAVAQNGQSAAIEGAVKAVVIVELMFGLCHIDFIF